jgi:hypothetical protein
MTRGRMEHLLHVADLIVEAARMVALRSRPMYGQTWRDKLRLRTEAFILMMSMEEINRR